MSIYRWSELKARVSKCRIRERLFFKFGEFGERGLELEESLCQRQRVCACRTPCKVDGLVYTWRAREMELAVRALVRAYTVILLRGFQWSKGNTMAAELLRLTDLKTIPSVLYCVTSSVVQPHPPTICYLVDDIIIVSASRRRESGHDWVSGNILAA